MIYNVETATKLSSLPREYIRVRHPVEGIFFLSHWIFYLKNFGKNPHDTILSKTRHRTLYQWDYGNVRKWPGRPTGAGPKAVVGTCAFFPSPGDISDPGIEPGSPALQAEALLSEPPDCFSCFCIPSFP